MQGGEKWTAEDLFSHVSRYQRYWRDNGGITVSGGEPLLQMDFVTEFFRVRERKGHPYDAGYLRKYLFSG